MTQPHGELCSRHWEKRGQISMTTVLSALGCDELKKEKKKACVLPESFS